ncbi:MAG: ABC transporter permease [Hyphomicrobiaceae bacterium]
MTDIGLSDVAGTFDASSRRPRRGRSALFWRIAVAAAFLATWHYAVEAKLIDKFWISSPAEVLSRIVGWFATGEIWPHLGATVLETVAGFLFGCLFGVVFGLIFGMSRRVADVMEIYIVALYSMPKVALAPLFILWFGIGITSKIMLAAIGVFFLVFYNTYSGALNTERELLDVIRLMGGNQSHIIRKVILPSALVWIFTGMKIAIPYALIGAVVGEMMAANRGVGYLIQASAGQFDTGGVFAALLILVVLSTATQFFLRKIESRVLRWKA